MTSATARRALPFRLGATSYVIPEGLVANVRHLAGTVADVELVLFDADDGPTNVPGLDDASALAELARERDLTYTVHLPMDVTPSPEGSPEHPSFRKAEATIRRTLSFDPLAYVVHLDGRAARDGTPDDRARWTGQAVDTLRRLADLTAGPDRLAVENLEGYSPAFFDAAAAGAAAARCVDVGHLWLHGHDPLPYLAKWLPHSSVVHLHGVDGRDHRSLGVVPAKRLDPVVACLLERRFRGVVTLEVFGEEEFTSSLEALFASVDRVVAL